MIKARNTYYIMKRVLPQPWKPVAAAPVVVVVMIILACYKYYPLSE
jgi:hypothetical protein